MTFLERCIEQSMPVWQSCLETAFLRRFADGTLDEACFKGYIVDDSLYLREYAKVFAIGILHAGSMEEIRVYYSLLSFVNESEDAARRHYLRRYGLTDEQIQVLPLRPENRAYVDDMLAAARDGGGSAACAMACLPCMLSYGWIFREILRRSPQVLEGPFGPFVQDYTGDRYDGLCKKWTAFGDWACRGLDEAGQRRCGEIFYACSLHERRFWEMSAVPRDDI